MTVDHWEALFDAKFLRWFDLNGKPALVEITGVAKQKLTLPGGKQDERGVLQLRLVQGHITNVKPLVLNKTNAATIAGIHGDKPTGWTGGHIVLFEDQTQCKGKTVPCIRVRERRDSNG